MKQFKKSEVADFGALYQVSDVTLYKHKKARVSLYTYSCGRDVTIYSMCAVVQIVCTKGGSEFCHLREYEEMLGKTLYWQSETRVKGGGWRNQPLTVDCFSAQFPSSVPCMVASRQFTGPHNTPL